MTPQAYLNLIKSTLTTSSIVVAADVLEEYAFTDRGYFRARLRLSNTDFLEVAEYFVLEQQRCVTTRYRYQWMDEKRQSLKKRWDNVPHFPKLPNFPHHVHIAEEHNVQPGKALSIGELLEIIASELDR